MDTSVQMARQERVQMAQRLMYAEHAAWAGFVEPQMVNMKVVSLERSATVSSAAVGGMVSSCRDAVKQTRAGLSRRDKDGSLNSLEDAWRRHNYELSMAQPLFFNILL